MLFYPGPHFWDLQFDGSKKNVGSRRLTVKWHIDFEGHDLYGRERRRQPWASRAGLKYVMGALG